MSREHLSKKTTYTVNVAVLALSQVLDLVTTKGMIHRHGFGIEANPRKDYLFENMMLLEFLKVVAIPAIIITATYLSYKYLPQHQEKIICGMRITNTVLGCVLIINTAMNINVLR